MRRDTENFSMYSLMSTRISACSSAKRNFASARASSVLPTPVGPEKTKEPIGRRGSRARPRLVDHVDRLVGEEAVGDVALGELRRRPERLVGDRDAVVVLV